MGDYSPLCYHIQINFGALPAFCLLGVKQLEQKFTVHLHLGLQLRMYGDNVYTYLWCCIHVLVCSYWDIQIHSGRR